MTIKIGITGGIGSGKSTFSTQVIKRNLKLFDSDKEVSNLYIKPRKNFLEYLKKIGLESSIRNKKINKKIIREIIFSNKKIKKKLEKYIFQITRKKRLDFIKRQKKLKTKILFFDVPLLFENGLEGDFNKTISIISQKKERYKRIKKSKQMSKNTFNKILKSQTTDIVRRKKSDIIIYNSGTMNSYIEKINKIIDQLIWEKL